MNHESWSNYESWFNLVLRTLFSSANLQNFATQIPGLPNFLEFETECYVKTKKNCILRLYYTKKCFAYPTFLLFFISKNHLNR